MDPIALAYLYFTLALMGIALLAVILTGVWMIVAPEQAYADSFFGDDADWLAEARGDQ